MAGLRCKFSPVHLIEMRYDLAAIRVSKSPWILIYSKHGSVGG